MAVRPAVKSPLKPSLSNKDVALELVKAALQGGIAPSNGDSPSQSSDTAVNQGRIDGYYLADLLHYTTLRLDRRESQD